MEEPEECSGVDLPGRHEAKDRPVAVPPTLARRLAPPSLDRVPRDVTRRPEKTWPVLNETRLEAALKKMTDAIVTAVEALCIDGVDEVHARREVGIRRTDEEVVMVLHEAEGEQRPRLSSEG